MIRDKKEGRKEEELWFVSICACSVALSVAPLPVACQAPLSMEFSKQEHWIRLLFHPPRDLPNPGIKVKLLSCVRLLATPWTAAYGIFQARVLEWGAIAFSIASPRKK